MSMAYPAATQGNTSTHGGSFTAQACSVLAEGLAPLCAGDLHSCPLNHPALPLLPGNSSVLVEGRIWMHAMDAVPCVGPCWISSGCTSIKLGGSNIEDTHPSPPPADEFAFST